MDFADTSAGTPLSQDGQDGETYTIGQLAREFDITLRSIRFYEDMGLLSPTRYGTTRVFSRRDRGRLSLVCRGKRLGFSLRDIKTFLNLYDADDQQANQMRFLLDKTHERIQLLERQQVDIEQTLTELRDITSTLVPQDRAACS